MGAAVSVKIADELRSDATGTRLAGKVAIVTGAASGIGAACARAFIAQGAAVALTDTDELRGESVLADIRRRHPDRHDAAFFFRQDVVDEARWDDLIEQTQAKF